jgi:hypothetical protein
MKSNSSVKLKLNRQFVKKKANLQGSFDINNDFWDDCIDSNKLDKEG